MATASTLAPTGAHSCLEGLSFVFTGVLPSIGRNDVQQLVMRYGAKATDVPSKTTTHVVVGQDAVPKKLETIRHLGIKTLDENGLFELIESMCANGGLSRKVATMPHSRPQEKLDPAYQATILRLELCLRHFEDEDLSEGLHLGLNRLIFLTTIKPKMCGTKTFRKWLIDAIDALGQLSDLATMSKDQLEDDWCFEREDGHWEGPVALRKKVMSLLIAGTAVMAKMMLQWLECFKADTTIPEEALFKSRLTEMAKDLHKISKWRLTNARAAARRSHEPWPDPIESFLMKAIAQCSHIQLLIHFPGGYQPPAPPNAPERPLVDLARDTLIDPNIWGVDVGVKPFMKSLLMDVHEVKDLCRHRHRLPDYHDLHLLQEACGSVTVNERQCRQQIGYCVRVIQRLTDYLKNGATWRDHVTDQIKHREGVTEEVRWRCMLLRSYVELMLEKVVPQWQSKRQEEEGTARRPTSGRLVSDWRGGFWTSEAESDADEEKENSTFEIRHGTTIIDMTGEAACKDECCKERLHWDQKRPCHSCKPDPKPSDEKTCSMLTEELLAHKKAEDWVNVRKTLRMESDQSGIEQMRKARLRRWKLGDCSRN